MTISWLLFFLCIIVAAGIYTLERLAKGVIGAFGKPDVSCAPLDRKNPFFGVFVGLACALALYLVLSFSLH